MKKLAILAIGIPGSGKTTAVTPLAPRYGLARISRDDIRRELLGDPLDRSMQKKVWEEADRRAREALANGKSVLLDSTFTERGKRKEVIEAMKASGAERVIGIIFTTPLEIAKERNRKRNDVVREKVLVEKHRSLAEEPPTLEEGFDAIYTNDQLQEVEEQEFQG